MEKSGYRRKKIKWLQDQKLAFDYKLRITGGSLSHYLPLSLHPNSRRFPNRGQKLIDYIKNRIGIEVVILAPSPYFANANKIKFDGNFVDEENTSIEALKLGV